MKALIIGNNGYVGSHLTKALSPIADVIGIDLVWFGNDLGCSIQMDMRDITAEFLAGFDTVICLAAHSSVLMASTDPKGAVQNNVINLERLIQLMLPNQRLIYASSASVYGNDRINATEDQES